MVDCPYIDDVDAISTLYFVYIQFFTICSLAVVIVFVYFIWKEMKERIIDILKIIQHSSIVFCFLVCVLDNVVHLSTNNNYKFAYVILFQIDCFILIYYALNQLSWFVLSLHMTCYKEMGSDANYFNSRNSVKRKERIWFILLIICYILIISGSVLPFVLSGKDPHSDPTKILSILYFIGLFVIEFILSITELLLYRRITTVMKETLNYYYQKHHRKIRKLFIFNTIFFLSISTLNLLVAILHGSSNQSIASIIGCSDREYADPWIRVTYLVCIALMDTFMIVYIVLNTRQTKFKNWLMDILLGYRMMNNLQNSSIFIRKTSSRILDTEAETSFYSISSESQSIRDTLAPNKEEKRNCAKHELNDSKE